MIKHRTRESLKTLDCIDEQLGCMRVRFREGTGDEKAGQVESITDFLWNAHDTEYEHPGTIQMSEHSYNTNGLTVSMLSISDKNETLLNVFFGISALQSSDASRNQITADTLQLLFSNTNNEIQAVVGSGPLEPIQLKHARKTRATQKKNAFKQR